MTDDDFTITLPEGVLPDITTGKHDPARLLVALRFQPDQLITNHEGDQVYLRQATAEEKAAAGYGYLIDCCFLELPCERHQS